MTMCEPEGRIAVLLLESEPAVRTGMAASLVDAGFAVIEAENVDEAWSTLETRPDVGALLTDLDLPQGVEGLQLAWQVYDRWPSVGLVITSRHIRHLRPTDIPGHGCFLPRPLPVDVLLHEIRAATATSTTLEPSTTNNLLADSNDAMFRMQAAY